MRAHLTVEEGAAEPRLIDLSPEKTITLGRNRSSAVYLKDAKASRSQAEVFFTEGAYYIRNFSETNITRLDGKQIQQATRLLRGQVIGVGSVRIRFDLAPGEDDDLGNSRPETVGEQRPSNALPPADVDCARLNAEELSDLFHFMNASLTATTPHALVTLALRTVQQQTQATLCGFLSFDAEDSDLKVVLPAGASVNAHLSRQLTQKVRQQGLSAWLGASHGDNEELESGSLAAYFDAVCVPLRRSPVAEPDPVAKPRASRPDVSKTEPLGALHAYQTTRCFTEREVRFCEVLAGCLVKALHVHRSRRALEADNTRLREHGGHGGNELIGSSPAIRQLRSQAASLAASLATVLIEGESGVGKELVALALHNQSSRREGPLVTVNCAALTTSMLEAQLFGHEKNAFTDAGPARPGLFQQADEGTIFLDEIGELSLDTQARLLRVLEDKTVRPLMANAEIKVDVRILAATNRDLEKEMRAGRFRRDLFYRLTTRLHVPPLREHQEDVTALADHFLSKMNLEYRRRVRLSPEAVQCLQAYSWPGNVRQLRSVLETAVAMSPVDELRPADLRLAVEESGPAGDGETLNLEDLESRTIREALGRTGGVLVQAAKLLGIHRETLINKIKRYSIERPRLDMHGE